MRGVIMSESFYINSSAGLNKKAKQRHVFCLIKIPLVLTRQTSNASVPEMADSCARKKKKRKKEKFSYRCRGGVFTEASEHTVIV